MFPIILFMIIYIICSIVDFPLRALFLLLLLKKKARSFDRAFQYELFD